MKFAQHLACVASVLAGLSSASPAWAQLVGSTGPAAATATPAAPVAAPTSDNSEPASAPATLETSPLLAPAASTGDVCFPGCRHGFVCRTGECVSICNPLCGAGETCKEVNQVAECMANPPAASLRPAADPGAEKHDGFYLRLAAGVGVGGAQRNTGASTVKYNASTGFFSVDVGGVPTENAALFGRLSHYTLAEPEIKIDGVKFTTKNDESLNLEFLGIGISYYFMPINLYLSGALGPAVATIGKDSNDPSRVGVGMDLEVGKEWWVSDEWGIGLAVRASITSVPPGNNWSATDQHLSAAALGVLFSATYN